jgi:hypothetical protein
VGARILQQRSAEALAFYSSERKLVRDLSRLVTSRTGPVRCREVAFEFNYAAGRTDLVGLGQESEVHAFETKLSKWREALEQARRNACFAHYSYVALPVKTADNALKAKEEFHRHGVGLVALDGQQGRLAIRPRRNAPLLPWLTQSALGFLLGK